MELILWRHAQAQEPEEALDDMARQLTSKGRKQARRMAQWLDQTLPASCKILVSPAKRAVQTAAALNRRYRLCDEIAPSASSEDLLQAAGWPDSRCPVLLIGHQPALGQVAARLLTGQAGQLAIRKGCVWWIDSRDAGASNVLRAVVCPDLPHK
jgi:phosphohistidine phosphatase